MIHIIYIYRWLLCGLVFFYCCCIHTLSLLLSKNTLLLLHLFYTPLRDVANVKEWKKVKNCRSLLPALNKGVSFVKSAASGSVQPLGLSSSASSLNTGAGSNCTNNHGVPYSSTSNTIAPSSARISPAPFKQQQEPLPSSQLNSSSSNNANNISNKPKKVFSKYILLIWKISFFAT